MSRRASTSASASLSASGSYQGESELDVFKETGSWLARLGRVVKGFQAILRRGARETWDAIKEGEAQLIYGLFRRQLSVFSPGFDPSTQIEVNLLQRTIWLHNVSVDPGAISVLASLAPPGLNFTSFSIGEVRVSWDRLEAGRYAFGRRDRQHSGYRRRGAGMQRRGGRQIDRRLVRDRHLAMETIAEGTVRKPVGNPQPEPLGGTYPRLDGDPCSQMGLGG